MTDTSVTIEGKSASTIDTIGQNTAMAGMGEIGMNATIESVSVIMNRGGAIMIVNGARKRIVIGIETEIVMRERYVDLPVYLVMAQYTSMYAPGTWWFCEL